MTELTPDVFHAVKYQLPNFLREVENELFLKFIQYYYDWTRQAGQPSEFLKNLLHYRDIDESPEFLKRYFTANVVKLIPNNTVADKTLIAKHLTEFVRSKGSYESFQFIMKSVFGEDMTMVWNRDKLFRASANEYFRKATVAIWSTEPWTEVESSTLFQYSSPIASGLIQSCVSTTHQGRIVNWITLDEKSIQGRFIPETGKVRVLKNSIDRNWNEIKDYYQPTAMIGSNITFKTTTDRIDPWTGLVLKQLNSNFRAIIKGFVSSNKQPNFSLVTLEIEQQTGTFNISNEVYFVASAVENISFLKTDYVYGTVSSSVNSVNVTTPGSGYTPGDDVTFIDGSGVNVEGYVSEVSAGPVTEIHVLKRGYGYEVGDAVTVNNIDSSGTGLIAEVQAIDGEGTEIEIVSELRNIAIRYGGFDYRVNDTFEILGGKLVPGKPPASFKVWSIVSAYNFIGIRVDNSGVNYPPYTKIGLVNTTVELAPVLITPFWAVPQITMGMIRSISVVTNPTITTQNLAIAINGYGAKLTGTLAGGVLASVEITCAGVNYVDPVVDITGTDGYGAIVRLTAVNGVITSVDIDAGGYNYTSITLTVRERYGSGCVASPQFLNAAAPAGSIGSISILDRGEYLELPPCHIATIKQTSGAGKGTIAELALDFRAKRARVVKGGVSYHASFANKASSYKMIRDMSWAANTVNVTSPSHGFITGDRINILNVVPIEYNGTYLITNTGTDTFTYSLSPNPGAVGLTQFGPTQDVLGAGRGAILRAYHSSGVITLVDVINGGENYFSGTLLSMVTPSAGGSTPAVLIPIIVNGKIVSVTIGSGGTLYADNELDITINPGNAIELTSYVSGMGRVLGGDVRVGGTGYSDQTEITPISISVSGGTGAILRPVIEEEGVISSIDILDGGQGYQITDIVTVTGGGGTGAVISPLVYEGQLIGFNIENGGTNYKYGTSIIVVGDGSGAIVTPIVETGITSVFVDTQGQNYSSFITLTVTDPTGTGAELIPIIGENGSIVDVNIKNKGTGYTDPIVSITNVGSRILTELGNYLIHENDDYAIFDEPAAIGDGATFTAIASRNISGVTIVDPGTGYSTAEALIIGDGTDAIIELNVEKSGTIDSVVITNSGTGYTSTPRVVVTDSSGYGAVSKIKIVSPGNGYLKTPIVSLPQKFDYLDNLIADGTKLISYGPNIGGIRRVDFINHGAEYYNKPKVIFDCIATINENVAFKIGEDIRIKSNLYHGEYITQNYLLENGDFLMMEDGVSYLALTENEDRILLENGVLLGLDIEFVAPSLSDNLILDSDVEFKDDGVTGRIVDIDYNRNQIKIRSISDNFFIETENGRDRLITNHTSDNIIDQSSGTFDVGDIIEGQKSHVMGSIKYLNRAAGTTVIGGNGWSEFSYRDETGLLNCKGSVLADNNRYQDRAYVITTGRSINDYSAVLKATVHPAGYHMFGDVSTLAEIDGNMLTLDLVGAGKIIMNILSILDNGFNSEWSSMDALFGDMSKFNHDLAMLFVKDYTIHQTSAMLTGTVTQYFSSPMSIGSPATWTKSSGLQITENYRIAPDGQMKMTRISDVNTTISASLTKQFQCTQNHVLSFELYVSKQVNPMTFADFRITSGANTSYVRINLESGTYLSNGSFNFVVKDMGDYFWIRQSITTSTNIASVSIIPSAGFVSNMSVNNPAAVGNINVSDVYIRDISDIAILENSTGEIILENGDKLMFESPSSGHDQRLRAINSKYIPVEFRFLDTEAEIELLPYP